MKPDSWVLDVLNEGYKLPFRAGQVPEAYMEKNKSALEILPFVREQVLKYEKRRVVLHVPHRPKCVSAHGGHSRDLH